MTSRNFYDAKILLWVLIGIPLIASTNIDCGGKSFRCLNETHFRICVDLGGGKSTTVDDFVIPCPTPTVCSHSNRFECEFLEPPVTSTTAASISIPPAVPITLASATNEFESATTDVWEQITDRTTLPFNTSVGHLELKNYTTVSITESLLIEVTTSASVIKTSQNETTTDVIPIPNTTFKPQLTTKDILVTDTNLLNITESDVDVRINKTTVMPKITSNTSKANVILNNITENKINESMVMPKITSNATEANVIRNNITENKINETMVMPKITSNATEANVIPNNITENKINETMVMPKITSNATEANVIPNNITEIKINETMVMPKITSNATEANVIPNNITENKINETMVMPKITSNATEANVIPNNITENKLNQTMVMPKITSNASEANIIPNNTTENYINETMVMPKFTSNATEANVIPNNITANKLNQTMVMSKITSNTTEANVISNNITENKINDTMVMPKITSNETEVNVIPNNITENKINETMVMLKITSNVTEANVIPNNITENKINETMVIPKFDVIASNVTEANISAMNVIDNNIRETTSNPQIEVITLTALVGNTLTLNMSENNTNEAKPIPDVDVIVTTETSNTTTSNITDNNAVTNTHETSTDFGTRISDTNEADLNINNVTSGIENITMDTSATLETPIITAPSSIDEMVIKVSTVPVFTKTAETMNTISVTTLYPNVTVHDKISGLVGDSVNQSVIPVEKNRKKATQVIDPITTAVPEIMVNTDTSAVLNSDTFIEEVITTTSAINTDLTTTLPSVQHNQAFESNIYVTTNTNVNESTIVTRLPEAVTDTISIANSLIEDVVTQNSIVSVNTESVKEIVSNTEDNLILNLRTPIKENATTAVHNEKVLHKVKEDINTINVTTSIPVPITLIDAVTLNSKNLGGEILVTTTVPNVNTEPNVKESTGVSNTILTAIPDILSNTDTNSTTKFNAPVDKNLTSITIQSLKTMSNVTENTDIVNVPKIEPNIGTDATLISNTHNEELTSPTVSEGDIIHTNVSVNTNDGSIMSTISPNVLTTVTSEVVELTEAKIETTPSSVSKVSTTEYNIRENIQTIETSTVNNVSPLVGTNAGGNNTADVETRKAAVLSVNDTWIITTDNNIKTQTPMSELDIIKSTTVSKPRNFTTEYPSTFSELFDNQTTRNKKTSNEITIDSTMGQDVSNNNNTISTTTPTIEVVHSITTVFVTEYLTTDGPSTDALLKRNFSIVIDTEDISTTPISNVVYINASPNELPKIADNASNSGNTQKQAHISPSLTHFPTESPLLNETTSNTSNNNNLSPGKQPFGTSESFILTTESILESDINATGVEIATSRTAAENNLYNGTTSTENSQPMSITLTPKVTSVAPDTKTPTSTIQDIKESFDTVLPEEITISTVNDSNNPTLSGKEIPINRKSSDNETVSPVSNVNKSALSASLQINNLTTAPKIEMNTPTNTTAFRHSDKINAESRNTATPSTMRSQTDELLTQTSTTTEYERSLQPLNSQNNVQPEAGISTTTMTRHVDSVYVNPFTSLVAPRGTSKPVKTQSETTEILETKKTNPPLQYFISNVSKTDIREEPTTNTAISGIFASTLSPTINAVPANNFESSSPAMALARSNTNTDSLSTNIPTWETAAAQESINSDTLRYITTIAPETIPVPEYENKVSNLSAINSTTSRNSGREISNLTNPLENVPFNTHETSTRHHLITSEPVATTDRPIGFQSQTEKNLPDSTTSMKVSTAYNPEATISVRSNTKQNVLSRTTVPQTVDESISSDVRKSSNKDDLEIIPLTQSENQANVLANVANKSTASPNNGSQISNITNPIENVVFNTQDESTNDNLTKSVSTATTSQPAGTPTSTENSSSTIQSTGSLSLTDAFWSGQKYETQIGTTSPNVLDNRPLAVNNSHVSGLPDRVEIINRNNKKSTINSVGVFNHSETNFKVPVPISENTQSTDNMVKEDQNAANVSKWRPTPEPVKNNFNNISLAMQSTSILSITTSNIKLNVTETTFTNSSVEYHTTVSETKVNNQLSTDSNTASLPNSVLVKTSPLNKESNLSNNDKTNTPVIIIDKQKLNKNHNVNIELSFVHNSSNHLTESSTSSTQTATTNPKSSNTATVTEASVRQTQTTRSIIGSTHPEVTTGHLSILNTVNVDVERTNVARILNFDCQNRRRGRYSDNKDCRKFYVCIGVREPIEGLCPVNTVFSETKKQCTKNLSYCIRENQFKCVTNGRFSDFLEHNVYFICVKNHREEFVRFKFKCQNGYKLNKITVRCVVEEPEPPNKSTSNDSEATIEKSSRSNNRHVSKTDDKSYSTNKNAKGDILKTGNDKSSSGRKKGNEDFECEEEGKFRDPKSCRRYYVCSKSNRSEEYRQRRKKCDSDEVFDKDKKKCVDADSFECS